MKWLLESFAFAQPAELDRPIFLVGCAKSGTSMLGAIFSMHPDIGPKSPHANKFESAQRFLNSLVDPHVHAVVAHEMEYKEVWDKYLPVENVSLRIGNGLILEENPLTTRQTRRLVGELTRDFHAARFFSKQPFNTFRVKFLRQVFPNCKIICIHRDGRDVVSSWGREQNRWELFGGFDAAIRTFSSKWNEAVEYVEDKKRELEIYTLRYEDLVSDPRQALQNIFEACELSYVPQIYDSLELACQVGLWKVRIPPEHHQLLGDLLDRNLTRLGYY